MALLGGQVGMFGALMGRHYARQQMQNRISAASDSPRISANVQHLTISRSELQSAGSTFVWVEEQEFRYRGHLYDIVSEEWRGSVWHVWVYHDREEERYVDLLSQTVNTPILEDTTAPVRQWHIGFRPVALVPSALASPPPPRLRVQSFSRFSVTEHQAPYLEVSHPPPWG